MSVRSCAALAGSIVALLSGAPLGAQSRQSSLTILVVDPVGAPIAGARVASVSRDGRVFDRSCGVQGFRAAGRVVRGGLAVTL